MLYAKLNILTVKRALQFHKNVRNDGIGTMLSYGGGPMIVTDIIVGLSCSLCSLFVDYFHLSFGDLHCYLLVSIYCQHYLTRSIRAALLELPYM